MESPPSVIALGVGVTITKEILAVIAPGMRINFDLAVPACQRALDYGRANSPLRAAGCLSRFAEETDGFTLFVEEVAQGENTLREPFDLYIGRMGNVTLEDAQAFPGTGLAQSTGKDGAEKDQAFVRGLGFEVDFIAHPELRISADFLGFESARYLCEHPQILDACDAGDVDGVSCWVNAGCSKGAWIQRHGELIDGADARAENKANGWGPGSPQRKHGINGLKAARLYYSRARPALGC